MERHRKVLPISRYVCRTTTKNHSFGRQPGMEAFTKTGISDMKRWSEVCGTAPKCCRSRCTRVEVSMRRKRRRVMSGTYALTSQPLYGSTDGEGGTFRSSGYGERSVAAQAC